MTLTRQERKEYLEKRGIAGYTLSNFGGIEIKDIINGFDDYVVFTYYDFPEVHIRKIYYTLGAEARCYFRFGSMRIYLDECMRF